MEDEEADFASKLISAVAMSKQSTTDFLDEVSSKLYPFRAELGLKSSNRNPEDVFDMDENFDSAFAPSDMRCLALVSHNEMKAAMKNFVILHKNILKKFRLTGTNSTMTMLKEVFNSDNSVVFGPSCQSGPLGGDAELVALMCSGGLGGMLFFQDPMSAHPHQSDIDCLCRQALVHNVMSCNTPTTAYMVVNTLRTALQGEGRPELIPSFFFTLQSPSVVTYKLAQKKVIASHSAEETRASLMNRLTCSSDSGTEDNKIDVSFKTATTATTVPTTPNSFSTPRSTRRKKESVQHSLMDGLSQSSPCFSNITGVSYGSENSSISDLKIKKRQIERSFEMKYSVSPKTVVEGIQSERGFRHDER
jgi:methylglyoxal synthase